jgi:membrane-associated phospholipid phosphatase
MIARASERAAERLALAVAGALAVVVVAVPLAVLVRLAWPPLVDTDDAFTAAAERAVSSSPGLLAAARVVTLLGDPPLLTLVTVALAGVLWIRGHARLAVFLVAVRLGAQVLSTGMKLAVDRARPVFDVPVDTGLGGSFPSGHSIAAASMWTALAVVALPLVRSGRRRYLMGAALGVAVLVATSRVLLGVHYVSDVVGGLLVGCGWTALCVALLVRWRAEEGVAVEMVTDAVGADDDVSGASAPAAEPDPTDRRR